MSEGQGRGAAVARWWQARVADRNSGAARGLAARLRRATALEALGEPAVQALAHKLHIGPARADGLIRLVQVLADLRENDPATLARRLGGEPPAMSHLRFQRLLRATGDEATLALRRAVVMAERRCNAARLAADLLDWDDPERGEAARRRWIFDYFAAPQPEAPQPDADTAPQETDA